VAGGRRGLGTVGVVEKKSSPNGPFASRGKQQPLRLKPNGTPGGRGICTGKETTKLQQNVRDGESNYTEGSMKLGKKDNRGERPEIILFLYQS